MILHCTDCNKTFYSPYKCKICPVCGKETITDGKFSAFHQLRKSTYYPGPAADFSSLLLSDYQCTCDDFDKLRYTLFEKSEHMPSTALKQQLIQIENLMKYLEEAMESLDELVNQPTTQHQMTENQEEINAYHLPSVRA